ncbi:hypothetical protein [Acuticoccus mangrovi]|uniref:Uncharacterized protein n=1 Tax=Acuticoccus mangrovi TaxID=2796142 RepID=A0A934MNL1_9HYPH|nr:hypothetical protein [Acuticoccus mangrovi]MBJ3778289.1 hypothetical protein [Acuticoccus mangrovi]
MRRQPLVLIAALVAALACPLWAHAYAPEDVVLEPSDQATEKSPLSPTTGEKSSRPDRLLRQDDDEEDVPEDPHSVDMEATGVPAPTRAGIDDVRYDPAELPSAVAETRRLLIDAARTGDIDKLRDVFARQRAAPLVANFSTTPDAVNSLRSQSGDAEGQEILAILMEILETGYVHVGPPEGGTYVWPYFAEVPLADLTPRHYVELYRLLTSLDVEEMERMGRYTFFRVGISADGRLRYFSAGDLDE